MAAIDYGAIAFKNGKLIQKDRFGDMKEMVGWEDTEQDVEKYEQGSKDNFCYIRQLKNNYFTYVGDSECTVAFYKNQIVLVRRYNNGKVDYSHQYLNYINYSWYKRMCYNIQICLLDPNLTVTKRNGYYVCKWKYKGDKYKVYFGYGVDFPLYKKWRIVNAYRTPAHLFKLFKDFIKETIYDFKHGII